MDATELRPLSLGELMDRTFRLYRQHFWLFVGIMAIPSAFSIPFTVVIFSVQGPFIGSDNPRRRRLVGQFLFGVAFLCVFAVIRDRHRGDDDRCFGILSRAENHGARCVRESPGNIWRIMGVVSVVRSAHMEC